MAVNSSIEWTDSTWNPVTGCDKISPGCAHCYAERLAVRLRAMGVRNYSSGFRLALHEEALDLPLRWKKPQMIFVNSMSDLFHAEIPESFIHRVFSTMNASGIHRFQVLTKRSSRLRDLGSRLRWNENIWVGVSVETRAYTFRIDDLRRVPAAVKFLSLEPLLGPVPDLDLEGIDWVILGGESGPGARPLKETWVTAVRDQCLAQGVPFFFKQWGGPKKKTKGRTLEGRTWSQMPCSPAGLV
jgi:protein gp37